MSAISVHVIGLTIGGKQLGRVIAEGSAIGATAPIVIAPAVTLRVLPRAVPFTAPIPLNFPFTISLPTTIFTAILTMVVMATLLLTLLILMVLLPMTVALVLTPMGLTILTATVAGPMFFSVLLCLTASHFASLLRVDLTIMNRGN